MAESKGYSLGTGFIHATVSFDGVGQQIAKEMRKVTPKAGQDAGKRVGKAMREGIEDEAAKVDLKSYEAHVTAVEKRVAKQVADSAATQEASKRKLQIAEAKLAEARAKYKDGSSQILAAEDRLADARGKLARETYSAEEAQRKLNDELSDAKGALDEARRGAEQSADAYKKSFGPKFVRQIHDALRESVSSQTAVAAAAGFGAMAGAAWGKGFKRALGSENIGKSMMSAVAGISGLRVLSDIGGGFRDFVSNLDRSVPRIGLVSVALAGISAAGIAAVGGLVGVVNALGSIAAVGLTLPGMLGAGAASMAVFTMAMMDVTTVLADVGPMFQELQDSVSGAFWDRAAGPILNLANAVFPILLTRMTEVAHEMGGFGVAIANTVNSALGLAQLDQMFVYLRDALDVAGDGVGAMTNAIMTLGLVGASYLPDLASWFNSISFSFENWVQQASASGEIFAWIDTGLTNLKALGSVLVNTVGIFHNLGVAATEAGAGGLVGMAAGLDRINTALGTDLWQGRLVSMFSAAGASMDAVGRGLSAFGGGLVNLGPTLNNVMVLSGLAIGELLKGFGAVMSHPAVGGGLQSMFEGFLNGVRDMAPAASGIGAILGGVMNVIGLFASTLGGVVATAVSAVGPAFVAISSAVAPLIPLLGTALMNALDFLQPAFAAIGVVLTNVVAPVLKAVFGFIADNTTLILVLGTAFGAAAAVVAAFGAATWVAGGGLTALIAAKLTAATATKAYTAAQWLLNTALTMNPIGLVIAALVALGVGLVLAWKHSETFRNVVTGAWNGIKAAASAVAGWFTGTLVPGFSSAVASVGGAFTRLYTGFVLPVMGWVRGAISNVVDWFAGTVVPNFHKSIAALGEFFNWLYRNFIAPFVWAFRMAILAVSTWFRDTIVPRFNKAVTAIGNVFRWLNDKIIQPVWTWIQNKIGAVANWFNTKRLELQARIAALGDAFKRLYNAYVKPVWDWIRAKIDAVMRWFRDTLVPVFRAAIQRVVDKFNNFKSSVNTVWENVKTLLRAGWDWVDRNVFAKFRSGLDTLKTAFSRTKDGIAGIWQKLREAVRKPVDLVVTKVINPFVSGYNKLNNFWSGDDLDPLKGWSDGYARGGVIPGYQSAKKDDRLIPMRSGEGVLVPEAVRGIGAETIHKLNAAGNSGGVSAARTAWRNMQNPATMALGDHVHGQASFNGPPQQAIARTGELRVSGTAPGWGLQQAIRMMDAATSIRVVKGNSMRSGGNNTPVMAANYPGVQWGGYYSLDDASIALNNATMGHVSTRDKTIVTAHEIGHALGMPHAMSWQGGNGARSIMNYDTMFQDGGPTAADIAALAKIYGGTGRSMSPGSASGDDGNVWLDELKALVTKPIKAVKDMFPGNKFLQMPLGLADKVVTGVIDKAASLIGLGGGDDGPAGNEQVTKWMTTALKMKGLYSGANLESGVRRAMQESGGDPRAVNNWDVNALRGDPSKGLMQTIGATFKQYMEPGHSDIFNAIDNILASINYTLARYGSLKAGWDRPGGYATGGIVGERPKIYSGNTWDDPVGTVHKLSPGVSSIYNGTGGDEFFQRVTPGSSGGMTFNGDVYTVSPEELFRTYEKRAERRRSLANVA